MKKVNPVYLAKWFGVVALVAAVVAVFGVLIDNITVIVTGIWGGVVVAIILPGFMEKSMKKKATALEAKFPEMGFTYQYKFTSKNGIFYIDANGRLGVVRKYNPEFQLVDVTKITDIKTHDGRQFNGATNMVSCRFKVDGQKVTIPTFTTNARGGFTMKSAQVLEGISKADKLCEMLTMAKQSATGGQ